jgi:tripartite-type tricarboxylate transporter receptor subunit TctC
MLKRSATLALSLAAAVGLTAALSPTMADPVSDFYKGKNIQLIVGYGPGGGYDVYARLMARFFGKHVPGAPNVVVQNMPGAGSLRAANYIYVTAPRDGTVIGTFARNMPLLGVLKDNPNVQFDPRKFTWLGSPSSAENDAYLLFANKDAAIKSAADLLKKGGPPLVLGGTAEGATGNDVTILLKDALDLNLKMIAGYPDSGALFLAADRKEIDGRFVGLSAVSSSKPDWLKPDSQMHVLMQFARKTRHKDFPDAPTAREMAPNPRALALVELAEIPYSLSRPFVAPPALPADRAAALQKAFLEANADPEYLTEANKIGVDVSPVGAKEAAEMIEKLAAASPDLLEYIKKLQ